MTEFVIYKKNSVGWTVFYKGEKGNWGFVADINDATPLHVNDLSATFDRVKMQASDARFDTMEGARNMMQAEVLEREEKNSHYILLPLTQPFEQSNTRVNMWLSSYVDGAVTWDLNKAAAIPYTYEDAEAMRRDLIKSGWAVVIDSPPTTVVEVVKPRFFSRKDAILKLAELAEMDPLPVASFGNTRIEDLLCKNGISDAIINDWCPFMNFHCRWLEYIHEDTLHGILDDCYKEGSASLAFRQSTGTPSKDYTIWLLQEELNRRKGI